MTTAISVTGPVGFAGAGLLLEHVSITATYAMVVTAATVGAAIVVAAAELTADEERARPQR